MSAPPPIMFRWSGEAFEPSSRYWADMADRHYVVGQTYVLVEHYERSSASHRHYFAALNSAWQSLPDNLRPLYPSAEHLRKMALIASGFCLTRDHVCSSKAAAARLRDFVASMDTYAVVLTHGAVIRVHTAMSQSYPAMDRKQFQESKEAVLAYIDNLLGVDPGATAKSEEP